MSTSLPLRAERSLKLGTPLGRRERVRFPLALAVEYVLAGCNHTGVTANLSSAGIFVAARAIPPVNKQIKLSIDWPALLDGSCPLRLVVVGRVRRVNRYGMALAIEKYEFCLRAGRRPRPTAG